MYCCLMILYCLQGSGEGGGRASLDSSHHAALGRLVELNHKLLAALGVSAPALEHVCEEARREGLPTKLTGAGGGGCLFSLLGDPADPAPVRRLERRLRMRGFETYTTSVGGQGVLWHHDGVVEGAPTEAQSSRRSRVRHSWMMASAAALAAIAIVASRRTR